MQIRSSKLASRTLQAIRLCILRDRNNLTVAASAAGCMTCAPTARATSGASVPRIRINSKVRTSSQPEAKMKPESLAKLHDDATCRAAATARFIAFQELRECAALVVRCKCSERDTLVLSKASGWDEMDELAHEAASQTCHCMASACSFSLNDVPSPPPAKMI